MNNRKERQDQATLEGGPPLQDKGAGVGLLKSPTSEPQRGHLRGTREG